MFWEAGFSCFFVRGRHIAASDERGAALVVRRLTAAYVRADAKRRCSASWDRESRAVAALRPAGYSSGRGDCARGGCSAGRCGFVACVLRSCWNVLRSFAPVMWFYRFVLRSIAPVMRSCWNVVRASYVCRAFLLGCLGVRSRLSYVPIGMSYVRSRLLFAACAPNRTACDMFRSCSAVGRDRR